ncbi:MAG: polysaccharide deacetylase family protein, partial [Pseudomonadota bacterium]
MLASFAAIMLISVHLPAPATAQSVPAFAPNARLLLPEADDAKPETTSEATKPAPAPSASGTEPATIISRIPTQDADQRDVTDPAQPLAEPVATVSQSRTPPTCPGNPEAIGVSRIIEIDANTGPLFGVITKQKQEPSFLGPKEVVLTFDDGPVPWITGPILETLAAHCTRATFFSVGKMAIAYPKTLQAVAKAGHTVG